MADQDRTAENFGVQRKLLCIYVVTLLVIALIEWTPVLIRYHHAGPWAFNYSPLDRFDPPYTDWSRFTYRVGLYGQPDMLTRFSAGPPYPYPAPSLFLFLLYVRIFADSTPAYIATAIILLVGVTACFSWYCFRIRRSWMVQAAIWSTLLLGFPALYLVDRGNIEGVLWFITTLGVIAFARRWHTTAAVLIGIAASFKIYPGVLLLLFLPRKRYKQAALGALIAVGLDVGTMALIGPTFKQAVAAFKWSGAYLRQTQVAVVQSSILRWDHSLFAFYKQAVYRYLKFRYHRPEETVLFYRTVRPYSIVAALGFACLYWFRLRRLPLMNQYICLTILSILLPYVSYEYTLVNMYGPLAVLLLFMMIDMTRRPIRFNRRWAVLCTVAFSVLFAPLYILCYQRYDGQVKTLVLLFLLGLFATVPLPSTIFGDAEPGEVPPGSLSATAS